MTRRPRPRFWFEAALAALSTVLAALALVAPTWIERATGASPDGGTGEVEWWLAVVPIVIAVAASVSAARDWRRAAIA